MKIKYTIPIAEITSENPLEAQTLLSASMRSYSPRSAGLLPNNERQLIIALAEMPEFSAPENKDI